MMPSRINNQIHGAPLQFSDIFPKKRYFKVKTESLDEKEQKEPGVYTPASPKSAVKPKEKQPLDEIIERINEQYKGT